MAETCKVIKQDFILHFHRKTLSSLFYYFLDFSLNSYDFRISNDKRPGDFERRRKFSVKFSLHDKCSETLRNEDLCNFAENVMNPLFQRRLLKYIQVLHADFYIHKSLGRCKGIERGIKAKDIEKVSDLGEIFLLKKDGGIFFQEIFRSYHWDDLQDRETIKDMNKLGMSVVKDFVSLYPFYLFAVIRGQEILDSELNRYDKFLIEKSELLSHNELDLLEQPPLFMLNKGDSENKFDEIFREYVCDARFLEIREPWMEYPKQINNLMKLLGMVKSPKNCQATLITKNKLQSESLERLKNKLQHAGFRFGYRFEDIHNRLIRTEYWTISLPKGIHMFKKGKAEYDTEVTYTRLKNYKLNG